MNTRTKMPTYHVKCYETVNFTVAIEAESEDEAKRKYELGDYDICEVNTCEDTYDHTLMSIVEEK